MNSSFWCDWIAEETRTFLEEELVISILEDALEDYILSGKQIHENSMSEKCTPYSDLLSFAIDRVIIRGNLNLSENTKIKLLTGEIPFHIKSVNNGLLKDFLQQQCHQQNFPGEKKRIDMASLEPLEIDDWITVACSGSWKDTRIAKVFNERFGENNWRKGYRWGRHILDIRSGIQIYEDAYYYALRNDEYLLEWLIANARDVFDTNPSNTESHYDYSYQEIEGAAQHWQDISLRRVLRRLGRWFCGDHLLEIRGHESQGYRLNPGQLPFHKKELLVPYREFGWWRKDSIEDFSISNHVIQTSFSLLEKWLQQQTPNQESCESILQSQDKRLLPIMASYIERGNPRTWLFMLRTVSLWEDSTQVFPQLCATLPLSLKKEIFTMWEIVSKLDVESKEIVDQLLCHNPVGRTKGFSRVSTLEPAVKNLLLAVVAEDPSRKLRHKAVQLKMKNY